MQLDEQQQAAVRAESCKALVIAGAGSGKTRVLTERIAHLMENCKASPFEIMAFTFTRKAAQEMKTRLVDRIGPAAHRITLGTMHSVALTMAHRFHETIGLKRNTTIYSEWEADFLLRDVARDLGILKGKTWKTPKRHIDQMFSDYYERGIDPNSSPQHLLIQEKALFNTFQQRCRENNALTYGGLLVGLEALIPVMARHLHIRDILVDECQDIDPLQWRIIHGMCRSFNASLFCVGDVDQSIYAFRGAVPEYLVDHQDDFDVYRLEWNYRSVPSIVGSANRIIRNNKARISKTMRATRPESGNSCSTVNNYDSSKIADDAAAWSNSVQNDFAILARNHALLKRLDEEFNFRGIPHTYIGQKMALTNSEEFRRFHAFLKLLVNPYDNFSFLLIRDLVGLNEQDYADVRFTAANRSMSHFEAWMYRYDYLVSNDHYKTFFSLDYHRESLAGAAIQINYMATGAAPYPEARWGFDVSESIRFVFSWLKDHSNGSIQEYLDWLSVFDIQDEIEEKPEGVTLATIHAAKGLEWPVVIVAGCNEGILPSRHAVASGEIEEERRLMYVAMTRARDQLVLTVRPELTESKGRFYSNPVSRFIGEAV